MIKLTELVDFELKTHCTKFCTLDSKKGRAMGPQSIVSFENSSQVTLQIKIFSILLFFHFFFTFIQLERFKIKYKNHSESSFISSFDILTSSAKIFYNHLSSQVSPSGILTRSPKICYTLL